MTETDRRSRMLRNIAGYVLWRETSASSQSREVVAKANGHADECLREMAEDLAALEEAKGIPCSD